MIKPVIIYIIGVSGSGKTTIGQNLSNLTGLPFFDADDFHSAANKAKMHSGIPLNDEDRKDWLQSINQIACKEARNKGAIIACSALKEKYRKTLSEQIAIPLYWVFLQGDYGLIRERMNARKGHFMPGSLLQSQFQTLEVPGNAINIDISRSPGDITKEILEKLSQESQGRKN